jgi:hypothetical protein
MQIKKKICNFGFTAIGKKNVLLIVNISYLTRVKLLRKQISIQV